MKIAIDSPLMMFGGTVMMFSLGVIFASVGAPVVAGAFGVTIKEAATGWFIFGLAVLTVGTMYND